MSADRLEAIRAERTASVVPESPDPKELTPWRVNKLEEQLENLILRSEGWHNTLAAQITAMSNQIGNFQAALPESYAPRREAEERHKGIQDRFDLLDRRLDERKTAVDARIVAAEKALEGQVNSNRVRIERIEQLGWAFVVGMLMLTLGVLFAIFRSVGGGG